MRIISGSMRNRRLPAGPARATRPTTDLVRGALFNILQRRIDGARFLDLFAGTGAVGLEAVSRGAADVIWVESDGRAFAALKQNVAALAPDRAPGLHRTRAQQFLQVTPLTFDVIFADPPYASDLASLLPHIAARLSPSGIFIAEHATGEPPAPVPALEQTFQKTYGGSSLTGFIRAAPTEPSGEAPNEPM